MDMDINQPFRRIASVTSPKRHEWVFLWSVRYQFRRPSREASDVEARDTVEPRASADDGGRQCVRARVYVDGLRP